MNHKVVKVLGILVALVLVLLSIFVIAFFAKAIDGTTGSCKNGEFEAKCSERSAGMGIFTAFVGFFVGIAAVGIFVFLNHGAANMLGKLSLAALSAFLFVFFLISWALMAKDMTDLADDERFKLADCDLPGIWGAAVAFGLFAWLDSAALFFVSIASWYVGREH